MVESNGPADWWWFAYTYTQTRQTGNIDAGVPLLQIATAHCQHTFLELKASTDPHSRRAIESRVSRSVVIRFTA